MTNRSWAAGSLFHRSWHARFVLALTSFVTCGLLFSCSQGAEPRHVPNTLPMAASPFKVQPFDLQDVQLLDSPFKNATEHDREYMLSLEPDRFLHNFRVLAGLPPKAPLYGGWESPDTGAGRCLGHYLSALSLGYRATKDARFKERINYIVSELALCQSKNEHGFLSAENGVREAFVKLDGGDANALKKTRVPWYIQHKMFAGLQDAHQLAGNEEAKTVLIKLADWAIYATRNLNHEQFQTMLEQEHGGMSEALTNVYGLTGEKKYLDLARRFYHVAVMEPLVAREDKLEGLHANTQIPKVLGMARQYELVGDVKGRAIAEYFWDRVVGTRTYIMGGNSDDERFGPPNSLAKHLTPITAETCNTYNMLKLSHHLFEWTAEAKYADYYERALYNHILASQEPKQGMMTYYVSLKPGHFKTYSTPFDSFWCCVGTGMENHVKYGDSIYFHDANALYVNLFIASILNWKEKGLQVTQNTDFPQSDTAHFTMTATKPVNFALKVRYPNWATQGVQVKVNGKKQSIAEKPGDYVTISRVWKTGDVVEVQLPMSLHVAPLPDDKSKVAFMHGPIVLAGQLGNEGIAPPLPYAKGAGDYFGVPTPPVPVLVSDGGNLTRHLHEVEGQPLTYRTVGLAEPYDVTLRPFYQTYYDRYTIYWDTLNSAAFQRQQAQIAAKEQHERELVARTVDRVTSGNKAMEGAHNLQGEGTNSGPSSHGGFWRDAHNGGWFSFDFKIVPNTPQDVLVRYWGGETGNRVFDVLANGTVIGTQTLNQNRPGEFFEESYPIPATLLQGNEPITVRFQSKDGAIVGGVFDCRIVKHQ